MKVWKAIYGDEECTSTISLHRTRDGAKKACMKHFTKPGYSDAVFDSVWDDELAIAKEDMCFWAIREVEVIE